MNNNEVQKRLFTSESVTEGHPDKVCDNIADAVLDAMLRNDPNSRVACECCATTGMVMVMGEVTTNCYIDIPKLVRDVVLLQWALTRALKQNTATPTPMTSVRAIRE